MILVVRRAVAVLSVMTLLGARTPHSSAVLTDIDTSVGGGQVGGFYGPYDPDVDKPPASYPPILPPDNAPTFQNYFMGRTTFGPLDTSMSSPERRVFFFFDMASVAGSIPAGEFISEVTIELTLPSGGSAVLANFTDDKEIVEFSSTPYSVDEILDPDAASLPFDAVWSTFGTSELYGSFEIIGPDHPTETPTSEGAHTIPLPGAIPDVEAAVAAGDVFIVTARLATFDPGVIGDGAPPAVDPYEYAFGTTDVVTAGTPTGLGAPELSITTSVIPESSPVLVWCALTVSGLFHERRRLRKGDSHKK